MTSSYNVRFKMRAVSIHEHLPTILCVTVHFVQFKLSCLSHNQNESQPQVSWTCHFHIYIYLSPKKAAIQLLKERLTHRIRRMTRILRSFGLFHFHILSTKEGSYSAINEKTYASPTDLRLVKNSSILFYPTRKFCSSLREKKVVIR